MRPDLVEEAVHFEGLLVSGVSWRQPLILAHSASWPPWDQQLGSATPFFHDGLPQHRLRHRTKCSWVETSERMNQNNTPFKWLLSGIFSQHYEASPCPNNHCVCPRDNFPFSEVIWSRETAVEFILQSHFLRFVTYPSYSELISYISLCHFVLKTFTGSPVLLINSRLLSFAFLC